MTVFPVRFVCLKAGRGQAAFYSRASLRFDRIAEAESVGSLEFECDYTYASNCTAGIPCAWNPLNKGRWSQSPPNREIPRRTASANVITLGN